MLITRRPASADLPGRSCLGVGGVATIIRTRGVKGFFLKVLRLWRREGFDGFRTAFRELVLGGFTYPQWVAKFDSIRTADRERMKNTVEQLDKRPLISVIISTENPWGESFESSVRSLSRQLYEHWELHVVAPMGMTEAAGAACIALGIPNGMLHVVGAGEGPVESEPVNGGVQVCAGELLLVLVPGDQLADHALYLVAAAFNITPDLELVYADEDDIDRSGQRRNPYFKPDWNPDLALSQDLTGRFAVFRAKTVRALGGFRSEFEGAHQWDLALRIEEWAGPGKIVHLPHVLCHSGLDAEPNPACVTTGKAGHLMDIDLRVLKHAMERRQCPAEVVRSPSGFPRIIYPVPTPPPLVSIIVPTRNGLEHLQRCLDGLFLNTRYRPREIIVVDNQSDDPATLKYLGTLEGEGWIRLIHYEAPFNFASINNFAVEHCAGELVCLLNNDVEPITADWLDEMVSQACRPGIGVVGAMLYYPNETIQHAGVFLNGVAADHFYLGWPRGTTGEFGRACVVQNVAAVTAACFVVRRSIWEEVDGMDAERFAVAFNDVDFCLKVAQRGYRNLWTPYAELYHHESLSRGLDDTPEKRARYDEEVANLQTSWGYLLAKDPALSPNHAFSNPPTRLASPPRVPKTWQQRRGAQS